MHFTTVIQIYSGFSAKPNHFWRSLYSKDSHPKAREELHEGTLLELTRRLLTRLGVFQRKDIIIVFCFVYILSISETQTLILNVDW